MKQQEYKVGESTPDGAVVGILPPNCKLFDGVKYGMYVTGAEHDDWISQGHSINGLLDFTTLTTDRDSFLITCGPSKKGAKKFPVWHRSVMKGMLTHKICEKKLRAMSLKKHHWPESASCRYIVESKGKYTLKTYGKQMPKNHTENKLTPPIAGKEKEAKVADKSNSTVTRSAKSPYTMMSNGQNLAIMGTDNVDVDIWGAYERQKFYWSGLPSGGVTVDYMHYDGINLTVNDEVYESAVILKITSSTGLDIEFNGGKLSYA